MSGQHIRGDLSVLGIDLLMYIHSERSSACSCCRNVSTRGNKHKVCYLTTAADFASKHSPLAFASAILLDEILAEAP